MPSTIGALRRLGWQPSSPVGDPTQMNGGEGTNVGAEPNRRERSGFRRIRMSRVSVLLGRVLCYRRNAHFTIADTGLEGPMYRPTERDPRPEAQREIYEALDVLQSALLDLVKFADDGLAADEPLALDWTEFERARAALVAAKARCERAFEMEVRWSPIR